jgi:thioredoxin reductase
MARPEIPGISLPLVLTFEDVLRCKVESCEHHFTGKLPPVECGETVLVWGDHFAAADAAEKLAGEGKKVYVVTESREFAAWMEPCHKDVMLKRFAGSNGEGLKGKPFEKPVTVIPNSTVVEIREGGEVTLMDHRFQKTVLQANNVVLASVQPDDGLYDQLLQAGVLAVKIGDAKQVRNLRAAVTEGANAGLTLDEGLRLNANRAMISRLPTEVQLD